MKNIIILTLLLITLCKGQVTFNTTIDCSVEPGCDLFDPNNWNGGQVPTATQSATVNYPAGSNVQYVYANQLLTLVNLVVGVNVSIAFKSKVNINSLSTTGSMVLFTGSSAKLQSLAVVNGSLQIYQATNLTVIGQVTIHNADMDVFDTCSIIFNEDADFTGAAPSFVGDSSLTVLGNATFANGYRNTGTGTTVFNNTAITGQSQTGPLVLFGVMNVQANTVILVKGNFDGSQSKLLYLWANSSMIIQNSGDANIVFNQVQSDPGSNLSIINANSITAQFGYLLGTTVIDSIENGVSFGAQSAFKLLNLAGTTNMTVTAGYIEQLGVVNSQVNLDKPNILLFVKDSVIVNGTSTALLNTIVTIRPGAQLTVTYDMQFTGIGGFYVYGTLTLNDCEITTLDGSVGIKISGEHAILATENATISGDVTFVDGVWNPNHTIVSGNVDHQAGNLAFLDSFKENLYINGSYSVGPDAIVSFVDDLSSEEDAIIFVTGAVVLDGTVMTSFTDGVIPDVPYNIIMSDTPIQGTFATAKVNTQYVLSYNYNFAISSSGYSYSLTFSEQPLPPNGPNGRMAGWKVFLIILSILVVLGAGAYGYYSFVRKKGYLALN